MNTPIKLAIGLATVGGTVGGGVILHQQLTAPTKDIHNKLISEGYEILGKQNSAWTEILKNYKERITEKKTDLQFDTFAGTEENAIETIKSKCEQIIESTDLSSNNYKKAKKWCTVPKTLTEILGIKKYRALNWNTENDEDGKEWDKKIEKYKSHTLASEKISELDLASVASPYDKTKRNKLKEKCKAFESKKHYEKDFEETLGKSTLWCAIKNTQNNP